MPRLSLVIPCPGGAELFEDTLASILQNRPDDCELLVIHSQPYSDPYDLRDEVRFIRLAGEATLTRLVNTGLEAARGDVLHLLACGAVVEEGWTDAALWHFEHAAVGAVAPLVYREADGSAAAGVTRRLGGARCEVLVPAQGGVDAATRGRVLGPLLEAGFYRRDALAALGGLDVELGDELADLDLALSLRRLGLSCVVEPASYVTLPARSRPVVAPWVRARQAERLFWRHLAAAPLVPALAAHLGETVADVGAQLPRPAALATLAGRLAGLCELGQAARMQRRLDAARAAAEAEPETIPLPRARPAADAAARRRAA